MFIAVLVLARAALASSPFNGEFADRLFALMLSLGFDVIFFFFFYQWNSVTCKKQKGEQNGNLLTVEWIKNQNNKKNFSFGGPG
jgi:hypothetical protein